jgi:hypothetical protein
VSSPLVAMRMMTGEESAVPNILTSSAQTRSPATLPVTRWRMSADGRLGRIVDGVLQHRRHAVCPNQSGRVFFKGRRRNHADRFLLHIHLSTGAVHQAPRLDVVGHGVDREIPLLQIGFDGWVRKGRDVDGPFRRCDP